MIGIVYLLGTKKIIETIPDVVSCSDTEITGKDASVKGIDLSQASFCIVESTDLQPGDTLGDFVDVRGQLPKSELEQLKAENKALKQEIAQTNNDMVGFQNFIFEKFPDLA